MSVRSVLEQTAAKRAADNDDAESFLTQRQGFRFKSIIGDCAGASAEFVFISKGFVDMRDAGAPEFDNFLEASAAFVRTPFAVPILCVSEKVTAQLCFLSQDTVMPSL